MDDYALVLSSSISGISNDMRDLLGSEEPGARLAVDYFVCRAAREIGEELMTARHTGRLLGLTEARG